MWLKHMLRGLEGPEVMLGKLRIGNLEVEVRGSPIRNPDEVLRIAKDLKKVMNRHRVIISFPGGFK